MSALRVGVAFATIVALALGVVGAGTAGAAASGCAPRVDDGHVVRATGAKLFVKVTKGGLRELVVRGVGPTVPRRRIDDGTIDCVLDLKALEREFRARHRELHGRAGRHAIRVTSVRYDAGARILRVKGRLEHAPRSVRGVSASAAQALNPTTILFANTFIPFDGSF